MYDDYMKIYPVLTMCREQITLAVETIINCYKNGGKLLVCGNGGSASDSAHICGELLKGFLKKRAVETDYSAYGEDGAFLKSKLQGSLPAIDLSAMASVMTATLNDIDGSLIFAQQVNGLGKAGDVFIGISTSGNSKNIISAGIVAKENGLKTVALTGQKDSKMSELFDITIKAPATTTPQIQELHLPVYHLICAMVEEYFWKQ